MGEAVPELPLDAAGQLAHQTAMGRDVRPGHARAGAMLPESPRAGVSGDGDSAEVISRRGTSGRSVRSVFVRRLCSSLAAEAAQFSTRGTPLLRKPQAP